MKIIIVNKHFKDVLGGSEIQCDIIAAGLTTLGHEIHYLAVGGKSANYDTKYMVHIVAASHDQIIKKVRELAPDIVYWRSCRYLFPAFMKSFETLNIPLVFAVSNKYDLVPKIAFDIYDNKLKALKEFFLLRKQLKAIRKATAVTTLNPDLLKYIPNKSKTVMLNAMENNISSFNWTRPYCVWVSNFKDTKRPELFIKLSKELKDCGIDFLMVGRLNDKFKWMKVKENLPKSLYYLGEKSIEEVNGILNSSLFQVHTCYPEGFGNIFIQAWMNSKPSISLGFDPGGFIEENQIGYNANDDFTQFTEYVRKYIENQELCIQTGKRAYNFASEKFSPQSLALNIEKFLLTTISSSRTI